MPSDSASVLVCQALQDLAPASLLALGPGAKRRLGHFTHANPGCRVEWRDSAPDPRDAPPATPWSAVYLDCLLETRTRAAGRQLLARLRDHYSPVLMVLAAAHGPGAWAAADFLAMGFGQTGSAGEGPAATVLYRYALRDYKETPEWLNSRFWAHPELFDKFRW